MKNAIAVKEDRECDSAKSFTIRKNIRSTTYEVVVHFSQTSRETLKDKILRLIRNEVRQ